MKTLNKITTGFVEIDEKTDNLNKSGLYIIRVKEQKKILAELVSNISITNNFPTAIFSDSSIEKIIKDILSNESEVKMLSKLKNKEWRRLANAMTLLADTNIFITSKNKTFEDIKNSLIQLNKELDGALKLVVIENFAKFFDPNKYAENFSNFDNFAREINICIFSLEILPDTSEYDIINL